jgi:hypothetical protein
MLEQNTESVPEVDVHPPSIFKAQHGARMPRAAAKRS